MFFPFQKRLKRGNVKLLEAAIVDCPRPLRFAQNIAR
jgi:hypothetical protein